MVDWSWKPTDPPVPGLCLLCDTLITVKFHPCGHAVLCEHCSRRAKKCLECKVYTTLTRIVQHHNELQSTPHTVYTVFSLYILLLHLTDSSTIDRTAIGHISILLHCILLF